MECKTCKYKTKSKANYKRHLNSKSHLKKIKALEEGNSIYECSFCTKKYLCRTSLCRHKKTCKKKIEKETQNKILEEEKKKIDFENFEKFEKMKKQFEQENAKLKLERDAALDRVIEMSKNTGNNNTFNIQVFLDKECKNAMPIMDFIKDLQFKLTDINQERPASTIESLSKCITDKLENMDETERPVHCTDQKRLIFHVKDASGWTKDVDNKKIDDAIGWANARHQGAWIKKATNDNWLKKKHDTNYLNMNIAMGKFSDNPDWAKKKVKRAIAKVTNWKETKKTFSHQNGE